MTQQIDPLERRIRDQILLRNDVSEEFFPDEAARLAAVCRQMASRFEEGGRLLAFGRGAYATDAQHVSVEFVHPVIVGKRALPALDVSAYFPDGITPLVRPEDIVMGFGPPGGDPEVEAVLARIHETGVLTLALPGGIGHYAAAAPSPDDFIHQEMMEILYHTLWETVHVFFEHREMGEDVGESSFLYPFLGSEKQDTGAIEADVAQSIVSKARVVERLRAFVADELPHEMADTVRGIRERLSAGGKIIAFGNGGSATDANDFAFDCAMPPNGARPIPAISLSLEPANLTAIANDIGSESVFLRQLIAHADERDVAVAFSTSGSSTSIIEALKEARRRNLLTVAFLGYDGGEVVRRGLAAHALVVDCDYIPRIQEIHATLYHVLRSVLHEPAVRDLLSSEGRYAGR